MHPNQQTDQGPTEIISKQRHHHQSLSGGVFSLLDGGGADSSAASAHRLCRTRACLESYGTKGNERKRSLFSICNLIRMCLWSTETLHHITGELDSGYDNHLQRIGQQQATTYTRATTILLLNLEKATSRRYGQDQHMFSLSLSLSVCGYLQHPLHQGIYQEYSPWNPPHIPIDFLRLTNTMMMLLWT